MLMLVDNYDLNDYQRWHQASTFWFQDHEVRPEHPINQHQDSCKAQTMWNVYVICCNWPSNFKPGRPVKLWNQQGESLETTNSADKSPLSNLDLFKEAKSELCTSAIVKIVKPTHSKQVAASTKIIWPYFVLMDNRCRCSSTFLDPIFWVSKCQRPGARLDFLPLHFFPGAELRTGGRPRHRSPFIDQSHQSGEMHQTRTKPLL